MPRYFIQLAYYGTNYNGWQIQDNTPNTIQEVLQQKLSLVLAEPIEIVGCGRTDTGVHAKNYYAHFDSEKDHLHLPHSNYTYKFNKILPQDIAIKSIKRVTDNASARFDAIDRSYEYHLHQHKNPFLVQSSLYVFGNLNIEMMNIAAEHLLSVTDFTSFSKANTQTYTNDCKVTFAKWTQTSEGEYVFKITANRFLRNMVRAIVGTLLDIGKGKLTIDEFKTIIENKNRSEAGMSVPAHALYLTQITYPERIFNV